MKASVLALLSLHFQETPLSVSISKKLVDTYQKPQGTPEMTDRSGLGGFAHCAVPAILGTLMRCAMNWFPPVGFSREESQGVFLVYQNFVPHPKKSFILQCLLFARARS
jgi:hypothetical protein